MQYLPRFAPLAPVSALQDLTLSRSTLPLATSHKPTILLAEDDDDILELTRAFLKATGYSVLSCSNGRIAAEVFHKTPHVDLLVTDLRMPEMSGLELAQQLTVSDPCLPVLLISGELLTGALEDEVKQRGWRFLAKPWTFPDLLSAVHAMLGNGCASADDEWMDTV